MGDIRTAALLHPLRAPTLEARLREALDDEQFVLHYQPKIDLASGAVCGLEALMRWEDPRRGLVPPEAFIPALEDTNLIVEAGQWAVRHALSQRLAWHIAGLRPPRVSVNISRGQLRHQDFVATICESLDAVGVGAPGLELELPEIVLLADSEDQRGKLGAIGSRGVNIAIDDCGTGEASVAGLAQLPVHEVKVDRPHIARIAADANAAAAVSAFIDHAHSLNLTVVAEGVETRQQCELLRALGCDRIQGHVVSRPLPAPEIAHLLAQSGQLEKTNILSTSYMDSRHPGQARGQEIC